MAKLIYVSNVSLDGYIEDEHGSFDWTTPDDELFAFLTDLVRPMGTYLYGRRLYETMAPWETEPALAAQSELTADFADVWQAADKIVYSTTLDTVSTAKTRLEGEFDPASVRDMKAVLLARYVSPTGDTNGPSRRQGRARGGSVRCGDPGVRITGGLLRPEPNGETAESVWTPIPDVAGLRRSSLVDVGLPTGHTVDISLDNGKSYPRTYRHTGTGQPGLR
jgi:hypothetical protein